MKSDVPEDNNLTNLPTTPQIPPTELEGLMPTVNPQQPISSTDQVQTSATVAPGLMERGPFANMQQSNSLQTTPSIGSPASQAETTEINPVFVNPPTPVTTDEKQVFSQTSGPSDHTQQPVQAGVQTTSPFDTPPAPATQQQPAQDQTNLQGAVIEEKTKKKIPFFLIILLILVVIVLVSVGYLAYQNHLLTQQPSSNQQTTLSVPVTTNPTVEYIAFISTILPIEFMVPNDWKTQETQNNELSNQKMIDSNSSDFAYKVEGGDIASGFELRVGPVSDLTKKYDSFDAFSAEENLDGTYTQQTINGNPWLVKGNQAKTLIDNTPLTITLYSSVDRANEAVTIFNQILTSVKISTISPTPIDTKNASPSASPSPLE